VRNRQLTIPGFIDDPSVTCDHQVREHWRLDAVRCHTCHHTFTVDSECAITPLTRERGASLTEESGTTFATLPQQQFDEWYGEADHQEEQDG